MKTASASLTNRFDQPEPTKPSLREPTGAAAIWGKEHAAPKIAAVSVIVEFLQEGSR
jgi:hypothetical protein